MFNTFGEFFWAFMSLSGIMFWFCVTGFIALIIKRTRAKRRSYYG